MRETRLGPNTPNPLQRRRAASEFLTLVLFFGIVYTGAVLAHGYGL